MSEIPGQDVTVDVGNWLRRLGLEQYEAAFRDNAIDGDVLPTLTAGDLKDLGITIVGHRRRMLPAITELSASRHSAPKLMSVPAGSRRRGCARRSWSGIRYLLFEYESCRARETHRALPIDWDEFMKKELDQTVEHVLPKGENTLSITYWGRNLLKSSGKRIVILSGIFVFRSLAQTQLIAIVLFP